MNPHRYEQESRTDLPSPLSKTGDRVEGNASEALPLSRGSNGGNGKSHKIRLEWQEEFGETPPPMPELSMEIAILHVLAMQASSKQPMRLRDLCQVLSIYRVKEEQVRERIDDMRRRGYMIGSTWGTDGGFYLIRSRAEMDEYAHLRPDEGEAGRLTLDSEPIAGLAQYAETGPSRSTEKDVDEILQSVEKILSEKEG